MANLIEFGLVDQVKKFSFIVQEVASQGKLAESFSSVEDKIDLYWSLLQIESACKDPNLICSENLTFLNEIDLN
jgi:hypothetical protein